MNEPSQKRLHADFRNPDSHDQRVMQGIAERTHISRNTNREFDENLTFGQRLADRVAAVGGSWAFIATFCFFLLVWVVLNSFYLLRRGATFDPYPYILLNLILSILTAIQAPIIMMSENRHAEKDRLQAGHDYEVNFKSELEILGLHEKIDHLRDNEWSELVTMQKEQIRLLHELLDMQNPVHRS